jgi:diadenylate cyclase
MTVELIWTIIKKIMDIVLVWVVFYFILKNIRNSVKMTLLFKGILFLLIIKFISDVFDLVSIGLVLEYLIMWGPLALIIIFQPEIRSVLEQIGRTQLLGKHKTLTVNEREELVFEIIQAIDYLKRARIGALIVLERDVSLRDYIDRAKKIYAQISSELLVSIFFPNNPLHDGGVIIQGDKISCAGAVFPTSIDMKIGKRLGTRHRAALGISEESDCISIIVSEETGRVSIAINGELNYNLALEDARSLLIEELKPKTEEFDEEIEETKKEGDNE